MRYPTLRGLVAAVLTAATLAGCQTYRPGPLDITTHARKWRDRKPTSEDVRAFVDQLAERGDAQGARFDPADGLSIDEGTIIALVFNPDLRIARLRAGVARATAEYAGLWTDPSFQIDFMRIVDRVSDSSGTGRSGGSSGSSGGGAPSDVQNGRTLG